MGRNKAKRIAMAFEKEKADCYKKIVDNIGKLEHSRLNTGYVPGVENMAIHLYKQRIVLSLNYMLYHKNIKWCNIMNDLKYGNYLC